MKYLRNRLLKCLSQDQDGIADAKVHASKSKLNKVSICGSPRKEKPGPTTHCLSVHHRLPNPVPLQSVSKCPV